jgi:hypothetical protein
MKISFLAALTVMPIRSRAEVPFDQDSPDNISLRPSVVADTNNKTDVALLKGNIQAFVDPCPNTYRVRKQWDKLLSEEQTAYLEALQQLKDHPGAELNGIPNYDEIAYIHLVVATGFHGTEDAIHNTAIFPTWHRWYLYQFETALRSLSGDCDLT